MLFTLESIFFIVRNRILLFSVIPPLFLRKTPHRNEEFYGVVGESANVAQG